MNRPRNGKDYAGIVAVILSVTLCLVLLGTLAAEVFSDIQISEGTQRLLGTIVAGIVGALGVYIGHSISNGRKKGNGNGGGGPPP